MDESKRTIKMTAQRYPADQRTFSDAFFKGLVKCGHIVPNANIVWRAAPLVVLEGSSKYRVTIDLRPISSAAIIEALLMPRLKTEFSDFVGKTCFATMNFCNAY